jgi:hypothetical protein
VLHKGRLLAEGAVADLLQKTGAPDMRAAFVALTAETKDAA